MAKNKNLLIALSFFAILLTMIGCSDRQKESSFPKDNCGYPQKNIMVINGKEEVLPGFTDILMGEKFTHRVTAKKQKDGFVTVMVPKASAINQWCIEESEDVKVIMYKTESLLENAKEKIEGASDEIQMFKFSSETNHVVKLKWVNINQIGKAFSEKEENYLLEIEIEE